MLVLLHLELRKLVAHHPHLLLSVGGTQLLLLPLIEEVEARKYAFALLVVTIDVENLLGGLLADVVTVLALHEVLVQLVLEPLKVSIADVLDVDPLDLEVPLELAVLVLPPEGECLLQVAAGQASHPLHMATLHCGEEHVGVYLALNAVLPVLIELVLVAIGGCPDAILNGLVDVVVISASDDDTPTAILLEVALLLQAFQMGERPNYSLERLVVRTLHVFVEVRGLVGMVAGTQHLLISGY